MNPDSDQPIFVSAEDSTPAARPTPERGTPAPVRRRPVGDGRRTRRISIALFLATCVSAFFAGMDPGDLRGAMGMLNLLLEFWRQTGWWFFIPAELVQNGLIFGGCLMGILLSHEMGHYLLAKWHRIGATPPFFIPMPWGPFGTMGAIIFQDAHKADRRQLFDIAIAGPLAGLVIAIPVLCYGVATSEVLPAGAGLRYGDPLLVQWIVAAIHGAPAANQDILINPALFAGWVGIFITALNLVPIGQLDGGHILYTLIGKRAHTASIAVILVAIGWMVFTQRMDYILILLLLLFFGPLHPPTANDQAPLGPFRYILGWLTMAFIIIGFTPTPIIT